MAEDRWMSCSACRAPIGFGARHWVCSVSTCNRARTRLVFCSVPCWDSHVVVLRHRDAWAVEAQAPTRAAWEAEQAAAPSPAPAEPERGRVAEHRAAPREPAPAERGPALGPAPLPLAEADDTEVLIVVSKLKKYVRERSGMNTSDAVAAALSDHVRALCDAAIRAAAIAGRKTVLDRDVPPARR